MMKRFVLNIMATTGITLVVLAMVGLCYDATVICISAVFQALLLNIAIYIGLYILEHIEIRYPLLETGIKLVYVLVLALGSGWMFGWYANMPVAVLIVMTLIVFALCVGLDMIQLAEQVRDINGIIEQAKKNNEL